MSLLYYSNCLDQKLPFDGTTPILIQISRGIQLGHLRKSSSTAYASSEGLFEILKTSNYFFLRVYQNRRDRSFFIDIIELKILSGHVQLI